MMFFVALIIVGCSSALGASCYWASEQYSAATNFFDSFNFETFDDPTHGFVDYIGASEAKSLGLTSYVDGKVYIGVESSSIVSDGARGRKSIRLSSKKVINGNTLVVIDLEHMPSTSGVTGSPQGCSVWPAFWTVGSDWPNNGEIDIIEYVNTDHKIQTTLHTNAGCDQGSEDPSSFTGTWGLTYENLPSDNCDVNAAGQYANAGCGIIGADSTVGAAFNSNGVKGGAFAMEWTNGTAIRVFYFPRDSIPSDLVSGHPNPDSWGKPYARFELSDSSCPSSHFQNHQIVFDTTFCGDWAGSTFSAACGASCVDFVKYNANEFTEAYWLINAVTVYDQC
jgi:hypothetical protein